MSVLIIAEPTTGAVKPATLTTVGAAAKLEGDLHVLVIGAECAGAAEAAAHIAGVFGHCRRVELPVQLPARETSAG
jgi:electron transfer flavoprotein alpha subunit